MAAHTLVIFETPASYTADDDVCSRCMSAVRTQIYLTVEQRERIDRVARARGITMAEVIRDALDLYLDDTSDPVAALAATFGSDRTIAVPPRSEWTRG